MPKKVERNELEYLRSENRRLKSENRNLKKQVNRTNKKVKAYEENIDMAEPEVSEDVIEQEELLKCSRCMGTIEVVDLGIRILMTCVSCGTRKTHKK
jgi:uncharacterized protein YlxW (UPF0749 family)